MRPSGWVILTLCIYLLLEIAFDPRKSDKHQPHPHRMMLIAVALTLIAVAAILYERGY